MPNGGSDFPEYGISISRHARETRDRLDQESQLALNKIMDLLADGPEQVEHRITSLSANNDLFLYTHPKPVIEVTYRVESDRKLLSFLHFVVPQFAESKLVFISYSHEDEDWLAELQKWLAGFRDDGRVQVWSDKEIKAGDDWREKIEEALDSARVAVLLVSQDFVASEFIKANELPQLLSAREQGDLRILWVAISESAYEDTPIERYQAANDPSAPLDTLAPPAQNAAMKSIYQQIKAALED